jgi:hypothetical protein
MLPVQKITESNFSSLHPSAKITESDVNREISWEITFTLPFRMRSMFPMSTYILYCILTFFLLLQRYAPRPYFQPYSNLDVESRFQIASNRNKTIYSSKPEFP